jgi:hypothetical protein
VGPHRCDEWPHAGALRPATRRRWRWGIGVLPCGVSMASRHPHSWPGCCQGVAVARAPQAVRPDRDDVGRQDVRQEPAHAGLDRARPHLDGASLGRAVWAGDLASCEGEEAAGAVFCKVLCQ